MKVYPSLKGIISKLQNRYGLEEFDFKQIDKFLYYEGAKLLRENENRSGKPKTIDE